MVEDMFEVSMRWPGRSCGTAGGAHSQLNRVAQQLNERSPENFGFETRAERDLMLVLHRPIEPTTQSRHSVCFYPRADLMLSRKTVSESGAIAAYTGRYTDA